MYRISITAQAQAEADAAYAWMYEHISPIFAEKWYQQLFENIETLTRHPNRCPIASESHKFPVEIRELLYGRSKHSKHRILFTVADDVVQILYVRHTARDEEES
ncbi:Plasmid stabilization system protein ParE [Singulisphaera sp. GP187]|uniref:type II toxin-antitoxin system RelE/ParE family toxin n=1 Tax=Singulisphaera sp. GP187 TaxID=1882752 RepID=UPI00092C2500|nr:type II toxin-antitoxin system RelE/ParE family toxin [Singulisphaera sp. GP187]SIO08177.1 Plasmid stabilization system protein ParE [Singulisphaera sp. GP187]